MKPIFLIGLFFLVCFTLPAQDRWLRGKITDEAGDGLPYVGIGVPGTATGTVSQPDGSFRLLLPGDSKPTDTLRISHLGYATIRLPLGKIPEADRENLLFSLKAEARQLATVEVKPATTKRHTFGSKREKTLISTNFAIGEQPLQNLGAAIGKTFNLKGKQHYLKTVSMFVAYSNFDTVVFRLQIQRFRNGKPAESVLQQNIYFTLVKHPKGWATFNLEPYNLALNEKVLLSLEWVGHSKKGKYIGVPLAMPVPGVTHYYKFGSQNNWKEFPTMSASLNLVTETAK